MKLSFSIGAICAGLFVIASASPKSAKFPDLLNADLAQLSRGLRSHQFTSVDLVQAYIDRILEVNGTLHAVTELNPDALAIAKQLDSECSGGRFRGPLHGIPVLIKGNIGTNDKMNTTAGSYALLGAKLPQDSTVAAKLRKAGAIILGKANLSQWANFRSANSTSGWSAYGGQCFGAFYPDQDPSGSSSGSAVSASVGLAWATLGTETDGSIVSPSDVNDVVGIKPTVGLTSRYLVVPISEHQDTIGPIARSVRDAAYLLQAIAGVDKNDNYTLANPNPKLPNYVAAASGNRLRGAKLGVPRNVLELFNPDPVVTGAFEAALQTIRNAGATVVDSNFIALEEAVASNNETTVLYSDFVTNLATYFSELTFDPYNLKNLQQLEDFTKGFALEDYPQRDVNIWDEALALGYGNTDYRAFQARQADEYLGGPGGLLGAIKTYDLDAVLLPTQIASSFAAIVGAPIISVPLGFFPANTSLVPGTFGTTNVLGPNLPFGIAFLGDRWTEEKLIGLAYNYEQITNVRTKIQPSIVPKSQLSDVVKSYASKPHASL